MKKSAVIFILALASLCFAAEEKAVISIEGMTCGGCVKRVTEALHKIDGVSSAQMTLKPGEAIVAYQAEITSEETLLQAVAALGYKASCGAKTVGEAAHCKAHDKETVVEAALVSHHEVTTKKAPVLCPAIKTCKGAGTAPACRSPEQATASVSDHKADDENKHHICPAIRECKELIKFHEAMQALHAALSADDFEAIRQGYPELADRAEAVANMRGDEKCVKDINAFEKRRQELLECVLELGKACKGDTDKNIAKAFDKMHDAYIDLGSVCK